MKLLVWVVWVVMTIAVLLFVAHFGSNVPSWDDWDMVPTLTGEQPVTIGWLWSQHNEHRVPLPRLILLGLNKLAGIDFRAAMFFDVVASAALAAAMILLAQLLRGSASFTDLFFPTVLLSWGQAVNLIWAWQVQFFSSMVLAGIALMSIVASSTLIQTRSAAVWIAVCLLLLPLCGANGVALVPALALWLVYVGLLHKRRSDMVLLVGLAVAASLLSALYFVGFEKVPYHPTSSGLRATLKTALQFLTLGLGPATRTLWPISGLITLGVLSVAVFVLMRAAIADAEDRRRAIALLLFLGAMASLALGLGLGRDGFEPRYITLAIPFWCCLYFIAMLYGPRRVPNLAPTLFFVVACLGWWPNTKAGLAYADDLRQHLQAFQSDLMAGSPIYQLIHRHGRYLHPHHDIPTDYLPMLRRTGVWPYRLLQDNPPLHEVVLTLPPTAMNQVAWSAGTAYGTGFASYLLFDFPESPHVVGLRMRYRSWNDKWPVTFVSVDWKSNDQPAFTQERFQKYSPTGDRANWEHSTWPHASEPERMMTVWISEPVRQLRIHPDIQAGAIHISELVLLVPAPPLQAQPAAVR